MKKSLRIFLASFIGIICGGLVLSKINGQFSFLRLIIGMIIGGPLGYLAYDFKTVAKKAPMAWNAVKGWKPNKKWWREFGSMILPVVSISSTCIIGLLAFVTPLIALLEEPSLMQSLKYSILAFPIVTFVMTLMGIFFEMIGDEKERKRNSLFFKKYNPFRVYLWLLPKYTVLGLIWLIKQVFHITIHTPGFLWKAITTIALFIKTLIIRIHRDERLVCMFDVMLGIVIFYFWGNLILSAIIGGLLAVLNWQIISVRILHLAPSKTNNA